MAASNPAENLQDETSCPICLDYFTDPVITECGHNFCRSCITQTWEGRDTNFPCPHCRETCQQRNLRKNRQLANVTEEVKKLCQSSVRQKEENLCEEHEEKLKLFCEEDQRPICVICRESPGHRSHTVTPIQEAVQEYKVCVSIFIITVCPGVTDLTKQFQIHLEPLRKKLEDLLKLKSSEEKKAEELRSQTEIQRQRVESDFEEMQRFLAKEKRILLSRLKEEEKEILQRIGENVTRLEEQSSSIKLLISEIEEKSQQPAAELLKDVKDTLSRCQKVEFPEPEAVSTDLRMDFQLRYPQQLKKVITRFGESPGCHRDFRVPHVGTRGYVFRVKECVHAVSPGGEGPSEEGSGAILARRSSRRSRSQAAPFPASTGTAAILSGLCFPAEGEESPPSPLSPPSLSPVRSHTPRPSSPSGALKGTEVERWMDRGRYAVPVTLDPETVQPELLLSEDGKSVRWGGTRQNLHHSPRRFDSYQCVLGRKGFTSGRHYWEVEVKMEEGGICELGVYRDSVKRKGKISRTPEEGYWGVRLCPGGKCWALTSPITELPLSERPRAVGILLDYEAGEVSFYNAENKSHLYTFSHTLTGTLLPFFCTYKAALRILPVPGYCVGKFICMCGVLVLSLFFLCFSFLAFYYE
ncbi:E3 ubiquitin-protein ligase TRIM39-like [Rhinatrema bivittatum]|uniref:E3 ubiquitin-protein ligase TRIM39-like n=1 Tax=Rhinatrema bivittatum TaxID=194408 RepID=UPI00112B01BE|nr:E3 ubiquitin-protein ligase TRIM39-like [Rhinatrema bivittatum]